MLANFFAKSKPINFIVIIALFFCYYSIATFSGFSFNDLTGEFILIKLSIVCLFLTIFFFYNFIISKNNLTFDNSYSFLLFVIFIGFFLKEFTEIKMLILFMLSLLFLRKVYSLKSLKNVFIKLFDAGFWLGILFILEPFSIVFFVLLYIAIYQHQKIVFRTLLIPIVGFITPLIVYFTYCFWYDRSEDFLQLFYLFTSYDISFYSQNLFFVPLLLIGLCTITAVFIKTPKALSVNNTFRKNWLLVIFNLGIAIFFVLFLPNRNGTEILFLLFPMAIVVGNGLEMVKKNAIKEVALIVLLIASFLVPFIV